MNFPLEWRKWVSACLSSFRTSILVNDSLTLEFDVTCDFRQGDPLSPILSLLSWRLLCISMDLAKDCGLFKGVSIFQTMALILPIFFMELMPLFLGFLSRRSILNLSRIVKCFVNAFGLRTNFYKRSSLGSSLEIRKIYNFSSLSLVFNSSKIKPYMKNK